MLGALSAAVPICFTTSTTLFASVYAMLLSSYIRVVRHIDIYVDLSN